MPSVYDDDDFGADGTTVVRAMKRNQKMIRGKRGYVPRDDYEREQEVDLIHSHSQITAIHGVQASKSSSEVVKEFMQHAEKYLLNNHEISGDLTEEIENLGDSLLSELQNMNNEDFIQCLYFASEIFGEVTA
jgi:hypothetical protein